MRPICLDCRVEMQCWRNDAWVNDPASGGFPATYWRADIWRCPGCGDEVALRRPRGGKVFDAEDAPNDSIEFRYQTEVEQCGGSGT